MRKLASVGLVSALCVGCANSNLGYDLLFGAMQPFYSGGGPGPLDQKRDFDDRVETWRQNEHAAASADPETGALAR